jgi:hypothetical protein
MSKGMKKQVFAAACLMSIVLLSGCAGRNYLLVDYQVPMDSKQLQGQTVRLQIADQRESKTMLSPDAAYQFPEFSGIFSLAWIMPDRERILAGEHLLEALFKATFTKRLAEMGIHTSDDPNSAVPVLTINLTHVHIDLQNRRWRTELAYDAVLTAKGHPIARENVHGNAERVRVIGRKGADTVLSEIFSDVVNRLDLIKLFRSAGLV